MQFNVKELLIMFFFFLISSWIGTSITEYMGITPSGNFFNIILYALVPFIVFYLIWKNWGKKVAGSAT